MNPVQNTSQQTGIIAWFARNSVAANLLMFVILGVGLYSALTIQRNLQPDLNLNRIQISMVYPGAAPAEVEQGIVLKIEEALKDVEAIKRVDATANESVASLVLELHDGYAILETMEEVKSAIDAVTSFPENAEKPVVKEMSMRDFVAMVQLYGDINEREMKNLAEQVKDELLRDPDIAYAEIYGARNYEIAIEIPEATLRKYQLTLEQVSQAVRKSSIDIPGGSIKTANGDIMLRARGQAYHQMDFEKVVLLSYSDGTRLTLGDIANINDGFEEGEGFALFDGQFSNAVAIYAVGEQDLITVSNAVKRYVEAKRSKLPEGVSIDYWADISYYLEGRLGMMLKNLVLGALLVFLTLGLFLDIKLAFWVMAGLPVCFLGTFALMPTEYISVTLNMISLFGFILVLGIVVDDAIIIGESAYSNIEKSGHSTESVIEGALRVATPATFGVLTTIAAFAPTLFTEGSFASFPGAMGWVVILCLTFSLIESKWILPAHLAHSKPADHGIWLKINRIQQFCNRKLNYFVQQKYRPLLQKCIEYRYNTFAVFLAMLIITAGMVAGGVVRYVMIPDVPGDFLSADLEMIEGTSDSQTRAAHDKLLAAIATVNNRYKLDSGDESGFVHHMQSRGFNHRFAHFMVELTKSEDRSIDAQEVGEQWRQEVGAIPGAKVLSVKHTQDNSGSAIGFKLLGPDMPMLEKAAKELGEKLASYDGLYDIRDGTSALRDEILLEIKPGAEALGLSLSGLGHQVRQAFYGAEAQRIQRGTNEVKVMVRYPREEREAIANLENMYIRTGDGLEIPFTAVADMSVEPSYAKITRIDSQRAISVTSAADKRMVEPGKIVADLAENFLPELERKYPGLHYKLDGESEETNKMLVSLFLGFVLALFGIYTLLAIPLKSYLQPLIIMGVIPFGIIGAIVGHILLGQPFNMMSFFGVIALSGVVVNDSLIMVDFVNKAMDEGTDLLSAVMDSGTVRFRAIMLTSLTTFLGLTPMLLEDSLQAQMVIPMATSLGFGIVFATLITLLLVPCLYIILDDLANATGMRGRSQQVQSTS